MNDTNASVLTGLSSAMPSFFGPKRVYADPLEVLSASELSFAEKREILSSWASDVRAVPDMPALRMLDDGQTAAIDDILDALKTLDAAELEAGGSRLEYSQPRRGRDPSGRWLPAILRRRHRDDDDDDPPPCPATIATPPRNPLSQGDALDPSLMLAA
jgi:hypothetical protein